MTIKRKKSARLREMVISLACKILAWLWRLPSLFLPRKLIISPTARIVIIKPCCLGDVVYTTPVIAALREVYPQAHIAYAVSAWSRPVVENNKQLNQIIDTGVNGSNFTFKQWRDLVRKLRREKFEAAIVLDRSPLLANLPFFAGIKIRAGIDSRARGFSLNFRAKLERTDPIKHEAELYLEVVRAIGIQPQNPRTHYFVNEQAAKTMREKAALAGLALAGASKLAIIHPGGGANPDTRVLSKRWLPERYGEIAAKLCREGWQVVVIGAKDEVALAEKVISAVSHSPFIFNLAGKLDIAESAALMQFARLYLGNDTGLTHLATAFEAVVIAVFAPSHPLAYRPYSPKGFAVAPPGAELNPHLPLEEYQSLAAEQGGIEAVTIEQVWAVIQSSLLAKA
jgi:lipopolysaccharide heptosyltransferase II